MRYRLTLAFALKIAIVLRLRPVETQHVASLPNGLSPRRLFSSLRACGSQLAWPIALFLLLLGSFTAYADSPTDQEVSKIGRELKCPVCQNISVADSASELAGQMRATIKEKLEAGESKQDIIRFFVDRYGEEVLLNPPKDGFTSLVWLVPPVLISLMGAALFLSFRRNTSLSTVAESPEEEADLSEEDIRKYDEVLNKELLAK